MDRRTVLLGSLGFALPANAAESSQPQQSNQKRFAMILANESYENKALTNILNDARSMSRTLEQLGFNVTSGLDQTRSGMFSALRTFRDKLTPGCIALVYYSGHGAQVGGENYLIPVNNAGLEKASDLPDEAMPLGRILDALGKSDGQLNLIILDACRDNPFPGAKSLGGDKGLAVVGRNVSGTLIAFAAGPGEVASSNPSGKNSLFTEDLVKNLPKAGLRLEDVFLTTRKAVRERSGGKQIPQEYGSLESIVFLAGGDSTAPIGNNNPEIKLSPTSIRLELLGVPAGAKVKVDDVAILGNTFTDEIADKTKEVEVSISATGFRPYVGKVTLTRGSASTLRVTMEPKVSESPVPEMPETLVDVTRLLRMGGGFRMELAKTGGPRSSVAMSSDGNLATATIFAIAKSQGAGGSAAISNEDAHATFKPDVELSTDLKRRQFRARILVEVEVTATGESRTTLIGGSGDAEVDKAVLSTLRRWKWVPGYRDGKEVTTKQEFVYIIRVN